MTLRVFGGNDNEVVGSGTWLINKLANHTTHPNVMETRSSKVLTLIAIGTNNNEVVNSGSWWINELAKIR